MAKMQIRVRVSELKAVVAVVANGSAFMVTDSNATARVLVAWLIRTGDLLVAALVVLLKVTSKRSNGKIKNFAAQREKLILIQDGLRREFRNELDPGEVFHVIEGPPWCVTR